ncbi:hypothetical protein ACK3TF_005470 [Chlorella vulgaris]
MRAVAPAPPSSVGIRRNRTSSKPAWASPRRSTTLRQLATSSQQDHAQEPQQQHQQQQKERQRADRREERHTSPPPSANHSPSPLARLAPNTQPGMPVQLGLSPKLALLAAAMLWGSYSVSVRLIFSTEQPPDAVVVLALRGLLQAAAMLAFSSTLQQDERSTDATHVHHKDTPQLTTDAQQPKQQQPVLQRQGGNLLRQWLTLESPPLWMAALELGLWNFSATSLQTLGLQLTSATRASFLIQATVMLTPLFSMLAGYRPGPRVWAACGLALAGTLLVTADETEAVAAAVDGVAAAGFELGGDGFIILSAVFYSMGVVRLAGYAGTLLPARIATSKSFVLGGLGLGSLAVVSASTLAQGQPLSAMWGGVATDPGQKHVAPAQAQVIFSSKPVWAAGLAWLVLGGEELGVLTWLGGGVLMAAGLLASSEKQQQPQQPHREQHEEAQLEEAQPAVQAVAVQDAQRRSRRRD